MIELNGTLISLDVLENEFVCNLTDCKGACCVEGDYGAPLLEEELKVIEEALPKIYPYMSEEGKYKLAAKGFYEKDIDGEYVTQCISGRDCVFAINENGVYKCAIEKAYLNKEISFQKPISCHLYPIRILNLGDMEALNYSHWDICDAACTLGEQLKLPVYKFLKEALIRKYGADWYAELERVAEEYKNSVD